jgi:aminoglycoside 6'-N-acetyltransferase
VLTFRPMAEADLPTVEAWIQRPHIARWWLRDTTVDAELAKYERRVAGRDPRTRMLMVLAGDSPVGFCQWYLLADYPEAARALEAGAGEVGIDYAIADPGMTGRGLGTELVSRLVSHVRNEAPGAGVLADPAAGNVASRRVLEKNGFSLVSVRAAEGEPSDAATAVYRLPGSPGVPGQGRLPV